MSKIMLVLPIIFLTIALTSAFDYGDSSYGSSGQYGRKRREIPAAAQQAQPQQAPFQPVRGPKMFSVNVADGIQGANQLRKEKWDNGTVTGMYANPLGNQKYQIIEYIADAKGYRILGTKVVDETELAQLGGQGKFSPQSGKAQVDITNDGESTSWTVTPDQINQQNKTQPEGRSIKDSEDSKDKTTSTADSDKDKDKMGKRDADDMGMGMHGGMGSGHMMGKRGADMGMHGGMGSGHMMGSGMMGSGHMMGKRHVDAADKKADMKDKDDSINKDDSKDEANKGKRDVYGGYGGGSYGGDSIYG